MLLFRKISYFNELLGYLGEFKLVIILMYYIYMVLRFVLKKWIVLECKI